MGGSRNKKNWEIVRQWAGLPSWGMGGSEEELERKGKGKRKIIACKVREIVTIYYPGNVSKFL